MSELIVKEIYDQLFNLESKVKKDKVYPIHKKLVFKGRQDVNDVYDWLSEYVDFEEGDQVLDAGCGVGFGTCLLAKKNKIQITGISLSEKEIVKASDFARNSGLEASTNFIKQSFDEVGVGLYDKIIAIESIKHSLHLSKTLEVLVKALSPGGSLYIIEDFYRDVALTADALGYKEDWKLVDVFRLEDYYKALDKTNTVYEDLTAYMPPKSTLLVSLKLRTNNLFSRVRKGNSMNVNRIFRGGYFLDKLYIAGLMRYGLLAYQKPRTLA